MEKLTFIIDINVFIPNSGGIVALHTLCHNLRQIGEESFIIAGGTHPLLQAPPFDGRRLNKDRAVVVYPEIVIGNPHRAKNVVRWILNTPGQCAGVTSGFYEHVQPTDLIFKYSDYFSVGNLPHDGLLTTSFVDTTLFFEDTSIKKSGSAFFVKKGGMKNRVHPIGSIDLSNQEHNWEYMANVLRSVEYFYCYDNACFWVVLAALCGSIPVVIPDSDMTAQEWYNKWPHKRCGIAYGIDQIEHAKKTKLRVKEVFDNYQKEHLSTVENFVKVCYNKFA